MRIAMQRYALFFVVLPFSLSLALSSCDVAKTKTEEGLPATALAGEGATPEQKSPEDGAEAGPVPEPKKILVRVDAKKRENGVAALFALMIKSELEAPRCENLRAEGPGNVPRKGRVLSTAEKAAQKENLRTTAHNANLFLMLAEKRQGTTADLLRRVNLLAEEAIRLAETTEELSSMNNFLREGGGGDESLRQLMKERFTELMRNELNRPGLTLEEARGIYIRAPAESGAEAEALARYEELARNELNRPDITRKEIFEVYAVASRESNIGKEALARLDELAMQNLRRPDLTAAEARDIYSAAPIGSALSELALARYQELGGTFISR
ncbi:MAG: hypothetical protein HYT30_00340 [Parcubacteria group bacterium]|nr:hypothetical protein [Parcubacteria group bacterium]